MKKLNLRSIPNTISGIWKNTPLVLIAHVFILLAAILTLSGVIGLAPWMISMFLYGILCLTGWRLYLGKHEKAAEAGRWGVLASFLSLLFSALYWVLMIRDGYPTAYIKWW
ncbi:MAG TPA: hypothetical protein VN366_13555 [Feifaniaceae bacterium]|nr:hypothetical protein [Feifaniaceae bacterium]